MKVALFTDTYVPDVNGVAMTLKRWVSYLKTRGAECRVFAPQSALPIESEQQWVERFYSIPFALYPDCRVAILNPIYITKALRDFSPDIVHVATPFNLGWAGQQYARKRRIPLVASYHTHFDQYLACYKIQWMEPVLWKYMLWFHQDCRRIYVPSRSTLEHLEKKGLRHLEIWPRGVESSFFKPSGGQEKCANLVLSSCNFSSGKFVFLYVGRLAPEKSVDVLLQAAASLPESLRSRMQLVIVGDGPLLAPLREQWASHPHIVFTGFRQGEELIQLYEAADAFVFPSATETFGNVVLEAMASGTPVIGAAAGGVRDNIEHGVTGWLCEPGEPAAFASAMEMLMRDKELRQSLVSAGREYAAKQSWEHIFAALYESYVQVVDEASGPITKEVGAFR